MNERALIALRAVDAARDKVTAAKAAGRALTPQERQFIDAALDEGRRAGIPEAKALELGGNTPNRPHVKSQGVAPSGKMLGGGLAPIDFDRTAIEAVREAAVSGIGYKAVTTTTQAVNASISEYVREPFPFRRDIPRLLDYLPKQPTEAPTVTYYRYTTAAVAAAAVAEGGTKPESSPVLEAVTATVRKIAQVARASDEVVEDATGFADWLGRELVAGQIAAENEALINGNGTPPALTGLLNVSGITTRAQGTDTAMDAIFHAMTDLRTGAAYVEPDIVILNPSDYDLLRTSKDANDQYLLGAAYEAGKKTLDGVPVLITNRIAEGTAIVANLSLAAVAFIRKPVTLEYRASMDAGFTNAQTNVSMFRTEERLALTVPYPAAIVKVTGLS
jgi:HK97 family phage major capsid protein